MEIAKKQTSLEEAIARGTCGTHEGEELNAYCYADQEVMCLQCILGHRGHHITTFATLDEGKKLIHETSSKVLCMKHPDQEGFFWCNTDGKAICQMCTFVGCRNHNIVELDTILEQHRGSLNRTVELLTSLRQKIPSVESVESEAEEILAKLDQCQRSEIEGIDAKFDTLVSQINETRQEWKDRTAENFGSCRQIVKKSRDRVKNIVEIDHDLLLKSQHQDGALLKLIQSEDYAQVLASLQVYAKDYVSLTERFGNAEAVGASQGVLKIKTPVYSFNYGTFTAINHCSSRWIATTTKRSLQISDVTTRESQIIPGGFSPDGDSAKKWRVVITPSKRLFFFRIDAQSSGLGQTYEYTLDSNEFVKRSPMSVFVKFGSVVCPDDSYIYVIGGQDTANVVINTVQRYDISADKWETVGKLPAGANFLRGHATSVKDMDSQGYKIYIFGQTNSAREFEYCVGTPPEGNTNSLDWTWTTETINRDNSPPLPQKFVALISDRSGCLIMIPQTSAKKKGSPPKGIFKLDPEAKSITLVEVDFKIQNINSSITDSQWASSCSVRNEIFCLLSGTQMVVYDVARATIENSSFRSSAKDTTQ